MSKTNYTLLIANDRNCADCESRAAYILLGTENEFLGFYCGPHGVEIKKKLEDKFTFQQDNRWEKVKPKKRNKRYKIKSEKEKPINPKVIASNVRKGIKEKKEKPSMDELVREIVEAGVNKIISERK